MSSEQTQLAFENVSDDYKHTALIAFTSAETVIPAPRKREINKKNIHKYLDECDWMRTHRTHTHISTCID